MYSLTDDEASTAYIAAIEIFNAAKLAIKYGACKETMPEILKKAKALCEVLQNVKAVEPDDRS